MANKIVIWIENKPELEVYEYLKKELSNKGIELYKANNVDRLAMKLDDININPIKICGFIVDLMLDGPKTLASFGKPQISWEHDETDGGQILLEKILKNKESIYIDIPTLILSVRSDSDKKSLKKKYNGIELVIKRDMVNSDWEMELQKWLKNLK